MTTPSSDDAATVNRDAWSGAGAVHDLDVEGWTDPGERPAMVAFADIVRGGDVLDIGVGTGRTTPLLRLVTANYRAVDFVAGMVAATGKRWPDLDVRVDDARTLQTVPDDSCDGVVFSYNGIDAVGHDERQAVYDNVRRVLRPGGAFLYSTLHKDGPAFRARPWAPAPLPWVVGSLAPPRRGPALRSAARAARAARAAAGTSSWRRNEAKRVDGEDWSVAPNAAHGFGLLTHFTTVAGELARLERAGFEPMATFAAEDGRPVHLGPVRADVHWFHVLARVGSAAAGDGVGQQG
jgi:SAM-dependent methyltransferase